MNNELKNLNDSSEKKDEYVVIKELLVDRERVYKIQLAGIQNGIISFCKNYNMFQGKPNFFNLTLTEQFEYNECIEFTAAKIKKDFKQMEDFYLGCKSECLKKYNFKAEEIEDKINQYVESKIGTFRPSLHPCVEDCVGMYQYISHKYYQYMVKDLGMYAELIDYKKHVL
jgi:hypothetical protein